ncbi:MAG: gamma-glutamyl-gamma-aminobutyrate hydrolase family protein, partial [candidate division WOR-3 bacterium]
MVLDLLDGVVMIGGADLDPRHDGYELHPSMRLLDPRRERFDRSEDSRATRGAARADWLAVLWDESRPEVQRKLDVIEELVRVAD